MCQDGGPLFRRAPQKIVKPGVAIHSINTQSGLAYREYTTRVESNELPDSNETSQAIPALSEF